MKYLADQNLIMLSDPKHKRKLLGFAPDAVSLWYQLSNEIEQQIQVGGRFQQCPDHATMLHDNIARVAALIHVFEQYEGDISEKTLRMATEICCLFAKHFREVFMPPPQEELDAYLLRNYMNQLRSSSNRFIQPNFFTQNGPSVLWNRQRLRAVIDLMLMRGEIIIFQNHMTRMLDLMPHLGSLPYGNTLIQ